MDVTVRMQGNAIYQAFDEIHVIIFVQGEELDVLFSSYFMCTVKVT
jgi:hypothetical protein